MEWRFQPHKNAGIHTHTCGMGKNTYIRRIGDQFSQEDFFVGVEGVDDERHQLGDLSLEGKGLDFSLFWHLWGKIINLVLIIIKEIQL